MLVVRPQPGHAMTSGVNERRPIVCRISCATMTSRVRSPFGLGRQRHADRVADALLQQHGHRRGRRDDALAAHAGLGEAQVQRIVAASREFAHTRRSGPARRRPCTTGRCGRPAGPAPRRAARCRCADTMSASRITASAASGSARCAFSSIIRASRSASRLPQLTPMRTGLPYSMAFSIITTNCGSRLLPLPTLPGLIRYLASARAHSGYSVEELVAVEVEIADQRHVAAQRVELLADRRHGGGGFGRVDGDAHQFRAGVGERLDLRHRRRDVGGVGVGHRLHDDRRAAADVDAADVDLARSAARDVRGLHAASPERELGDVLLDVRRDVERPCRAR